MNPLTSHPLPYQLELMLLPREISRFEADRDAASLFGHQTKLISTYAYRDCYWDTPNGDLHASASVVRTRHFPLDPQAINRSSQRDGIEYEASPFSVEYKGPPSYMHQLWVTRAYGYVGVRSQEEAAASIALRRPTEPLQMLFAARPDLVGFQIEPRAEARVLVWLVRLNGIEVDIAFHDYEIRVGESKIEEGKLIELQPNWVSGNHIERYLPGFREVTRQFVESGYEISPVGKYQRVPRAILDLLPDSRVYC